MTAPIETLTQELDGNTLSGQVAAAETLAGMAEAAQPAIIALVRHCGSDDEDLGNWCIAALESVGPPTAEQIDELALLTDSDNTNVAFWAVTLLGRAGSIAEPATTVLTERSEDTSAPEVQKRAAWALEKIRSAL